MLSLNADNAMVTVDYTGEVRVSFQVAKESRNALKAAYEAIRDKQLSIEVKQRSKKRSLDANAYLWVLCGKIAEAIRSTKEEVYRELVKAVGQYEILPIRANKEEEIIRMWKGRGLGWYAEVIDESKLEGYKKAIFYFGSSVYDGKQMARLIDEAIAEAEGLGIPTLPDNDIQTMKERWHEKQEKQACDSL